MPLYIYNFHSDHIITCETPTCWQMESRVAAHLAALESTTDEARDAAGMGGAAMQRELLNRDINFNRIDDSKETFDAAKVYKDKRSQLADVLNSIGRPASESDIQEAWQREQSRFISDIESSPTSESLGLGTDALSSVSGLVDTSGDYPKINYIEPEFKKEGYITLIYREINLKTEFTGKILIAKDFIRSMYVHMGFQSPISFQTVIEFQFIEGNLIGKNDLSKKMKELRKKGKSDGKLTHGEDRKNIMKWIDRTFSLDYDF